MEKEPPKKRGRKPGSKNKVKKNKEKTDGIIPEKKKRGRKPKTNITINENPIFKSDESENKNLIIKINNNSGDSLDDIKILDVNFDSISCEINNNQKYNNGKICWNCCHPFLNTIIGLPIKYIDEVFYTYGNFCSLECASKQYLDAHSNEKKFP